MNDPITRPGWHVLIGAGAHAALAHTEIPSWRTHGRWISGATGVFAVTHVDALPPEDQVRVGAYFREHHPDACFVVATHSPLVCRSCVDADRITLYPQGTPIEGVARDRLIYGNLLDAYAAIGLETIGQSAAGVRMLERLARLRRDSILRGLTAEEEAELDRLVRIFPGGCP